MTLDDAINYYDGIAKEYRANTDIKRNDYMDMRNGVFEAEQLASWLNELKLLRERIEKHPESCEDCISRQGVEEIINDIRDCISVEGYCAIVERMKKLPPVNPQRTDALEQEESGKKNHKSEARRWKRRYLTLRQQTRWIPVSERLPEAGEYVGDVAKYYLVQNEYGDMLVARFTHSEYWEQIYQLKPISDKIVAWMPLPKRYEPQERSGEE